MFTKPPRPRVLFVYIGPSCTGVCPLLRTTCQLASLPPHRHRTSLLLSGISSPSPDLMLALGDDTVTQEAWHQRARHVSHAAIGK